MGNPFSATLAITNNDYDHKKSSIKLSFEDFTAPFAGSYSWGSRFAKSSTGNAELTTNAYFPTTSGSCASGAVFKCDTSYFLWCYPYWLNDGSWFSFSGALWLDLFPASGSSLPTTQNITINSRPTSITGDYGIIGDDGTIIKVDGNVIVDESSSTIYNPVTNTTNNFTSWAYDYSDRSYHLTLETGDTITVTYGDENITINEGDTVYNVYYLVSSGESGGSGGSGESGETDSSSGWAWLKGAWTEMMDKLSQIVESITGLDLSPEINVDVEVTEGESETQESWFSKLLSKFSFVYSVHDIYSQLVADVMSDASTAYLLSDGSITADEVTTAHASVYAADDGEETASYTAPELAISFGSSDKYGVDWESIKPIDLSWYAPYKPTVDNILSGILWLTYAFLLIKRLPGIIHGAEMVTEDSIKIDDFRSHYGL